MRNHEHFDLIIIGTGAGGGTLARALAPSGKRILLLERGEYLPREKQNWSSRDVLQDARYKAHETWLDKDGAEFHPGIHYWVGGNTKMYGAALIRFRERDFGEIRHYGGVSPAWPIAYSELEPYYTAAERMYRVHGKRGTDPTEPPASAPYPHPPVSHEPAIQELVDAMSALGHKPFPMPLGINLNEANREASGCLRCNTCDGFPCMVDGKSDAHVIGVRTAVGYSNVRLLTGAFVERITTRDGGRRAAGVVVSRAGEREEYSADALVVACGAINSAALLLRSASDEHPQGLANGSGVVGRHYMAHHNTGMLCISPKLNATEFQKTMGLNDFYFGAPDSELPLGHVSMLGKLDGTAMKAGAPGFVPLAVLDCMARHSFDFWLTSEDLPSADNRVTLEQNGQIRLSYTPNNLGAHERLVGKVKGMVSRLLPLGLKLDKRIPLAATAHQCGTVRMGDDARASAVNAECRAHEVENLFVADASVFPSAAAVNPALTIMANALRVSEHVARALGAQASLS
ncbi:MAG TPA: GMC family oxidoreductase [Polyangiaceae bacterium]|nr:GMC family oxidoreductase [Polyangiaceae bacterium]